MQTVLSTNLADGVTPATPVFSRGGFPIGIALSTAYWALKLKDGSWWCEEDEVSDVLIGRRRLDWTLDIVSTGDIDKAAELWLFCPNGSRARLPIIMPGTAFQLKVAHFDSVITDSRRSLAAQLIGRVDDVESGDCTTFIYDYSLNNLIVGWRSNVFNLGSWRRGIAPIGPLSHRVLGLRLASEEPPIHDCGCDQPGRE